MADKKPLAVLTAAIIFTLAVTASLFYVASQPPKLVILIDIGAVEEILGMPVLVSGAFLAVPGVTVQPAKVQVGDGEVLIEFNVRGFAERYQDVRREGTGVPTVTVGLYNPDRGASLIIHIGNYTYPVPGGLLSGDRVITVNRSVLSALRERGSVLLFTYKPAWDAPESLEGNLSLVEDLGGGLRLLNDERIRGIDAPDWWITGYAGRDAPGSWARLVEWLVAAYYEAPKNAYPTPSSAIRAVSTAALRSLGVEDPLPGFMVIPMTSLVQGLEPGASWLRPADPASSIVVLPLFELNITSLAGRVKASVSIEPAGPTASGMVYSPLLASLVEAKPPKMRGYLDRLLSFEDLSLHAGLGVEARVTLGEWVLLVNWRVYDGGERWLVRPEAVVVRPYAVDYTGSPARVYEGSPPPWDGVVASGSLVPYMGRFGNIYRVDPLVDYVYPADRNEWGVVVAPALSQAVYAPTIDALAFNTGTLIYAGPGVHQSILIENYAETPGLTGEIVLYHVGVEGDLGGLPPYVCRVDVTVNY